MFRFARRCFAPSLIAALAVTLIACRASHKVDSCDAGVCETGACATVPHCAEDPTMMAVARDLDHLEKHIDWYGSATAKAPDVWGQARLTQYREEFEREMAPAAKDFEAVISGTQTRSDQSFLASATALSFAIQPKPPVIGNVTSTKTASAPAATPAPLLIPTSSNLQQFKLDPQSGTFSIFDLAQAKPAAAPASAPTPPPAAPTPLTPPALATTDSLLAVGSGAIKQNPATLASPLSFTAAKNGIGLEKTEYLNQKARYLNHLAQIRRNNEGDDTADSPGYSLNLIRIPVSVLPGKKTDTGHGAEVTMTIQPMLGEELLPATFRNLVIAGLTKELGYPLTKILDEGSPEVFQDETTRLLSRNLDKLDGIIKKISDPKLTSAESVFKLWEQLIDTLPELLRDSLTLSEEDKSYLIKIYDDLERVGASAPNELDNISRQMRSYNLEMTSMRLSTISEKLPSLPEVKKTHSMLNMAFANILSNKEKSVGGLAANAVLNGLKNKMKTIQSVNVAFSTSSHNKQSIATSQFIEVYGLAGLCEISYGLYRSLNDTVATQGFAHLPDVQSYLRQEIDAAYRLLLRPESVNHWQTFCTSEIADAVRNRDRAKLIMQRAEFRERIRIQSNSIGANINDPEQQSEFSSTAALAWMILVHSALLNERLILDMKETSATKQTVLPSAGDWPDYYHPCPSQAARTAFNAYVNMRWPVKVFAVDPTNDEQNIADTLSTRREMQLALSVAFTNGSINGNQFNKYARRLEAEYQTLDLNRTQVGFGHGENVFGWRFYPRFQTPDTQGNLTVAFRDQLIGGPSKDALLRERKLEPGIRECTALVIMPSFVPHVRLDVTTNWFSLTNPKHKVLDHTQALKLSQRVKSISMKGPGVKDAEYYRDGDQMRLINRAEQLAARLPMQTLTSQVPVDGNLGGFELFVHGTTDFAPELYGWYGAPGIDQAKDNVTLFLVGNHFSVTQSKVLIGNAELKPENVKMVSRQVMQVTVPKTAINYQYEGDEFSVKTTEIKQGKNSSKSTVTVGLNGTRTESSSIEVASEKDKLTTTTTSTTAGMESPQKKFYINVHVATPYGVTRELAVPVINIPKPEVKPAEVKPAEAPKPDTSFSYAKVPFGEGKYAISVKKAEPNSGIALKDKLDTGVPKLDIRFDLAIDGCAMTIVLKDAAMGVNYKPDSDLYLLDPTLMDSIRDQFNARVVGNAGVLFQDATNPFRAGDYPVKATLIVNKKAYEAAKPLLWRFTCMVP